MVHKDDRAGTLDFQKAALKTFCRDEVNETEIDFHQSDKELTDEEEAAGGRELPCVFPLIPELAKSIGELLHEQTRRTDFTPDDDSEPVFTEEIIDDAFEKEKQDENVIHVCRGKTKGEINETE